MIAIGAVATAAIVLGSSVVDARTERTVRVGNAFDFQLDGNPSTGYRWQLNKVTSSGLDIVRVESLGYQSKPSAGKVVVGQPAPFVFRIACVKAGFAHLIFDYVPPSGQAANKSHETWVRCE
ncbi:MAG: protease inhibitor I42 family protein [Alphaproteobacteria bacterium]